MRRMKYGKSFLALIYLFSTMTPVYAEEQTDIPEEQEISETEESVEEEVSDDLTESEETLAEEDVSVDTETTTEEQEAEDGSVEVEEIPSEDTGIIETESEEIEKTTMPRMLMQAIPASYKVTVVDGSSDVTEATKGTQVTLTPAEKNGYAFKGWLDGDGHLVSSSTNFSFEMPEWDVTYTAYFEKISNWRTDSKGKYYLLGNSYAKNQWLEIDGQKYRFDNNGYALVSTWFKENNQWYYLKEDGAMAVGWVKVKGVWYYMNQDGIMQTGWKKIDGVWYYLQSSGAMKKWWLKQGNVWYYLSGSGAMVTGWKEINKKKYYFVGSGQMKTGWLKLNNIWYYLDPVNGDLKTGWQEINKKKYYLDETTGAMATGWKEIDNKKIYFDPSGALSIGWKLIDANWYYFDSEGYCITGWKKIKNVWYYMDKDGIMQIGWKKINGAWYYLKDSGAMATGWLDDTDGKRYYLKESGAMVKGWQKLNNIWYYFDGSGAMKKGWVLSGSKWYYMDTNGAMATGWRASGGKWYYLSGSGAMLTGLQKINNKWYYLNPGNGDMLIGKVTIGTISYEFGSSGELINLSHSDVAYYSQTDSRWGNVQYGEYKPIRNTGCVPTSATMILNYLKGTDYTPADIAKVFYGWGEYNFVDHGTNSSVWRKFATNYSLTFQNNMTYNKVVSALKDGKVCTAAMGNGYFADSSYTHEIVFFGIDSVGRTYVYDPLNQNNNGWYSIREICNQLSTTFGDTLDDGPMFSFSDKAGAPKGSTSSTNPSKTPIGKAETLVGSINIRKEPSTNADKYGVAAEGKVYNVYEIKTTKDYTWYCIGTNQWIADKNNTWVKYTKN